MSSSEQSGGIGFIGLLTIVFITLKLIGIINWSWFWVLSPMLASILVVAIVLLFFVLIHVFTGTKLTVKRRR